MPVLISALLLSTLIMLSTAYSKIATRFVLVQTHHKGNVGAAARAIKVMGFDDLVLVSPRDPKVLNRQRTKEAASGAVDVLENVRIYETLEEAVDGCNHVCATAMPNDMSLARPDYYTFEAPRVHFQKLLTLHSSDEDVRIAFVFGNERVGMREEDILKCDAVLGIPTNPEFGSLNLGSAVQLIAYDWREAIGGYRVS